jgi:hypothetical protein
MYVTPPFLHYIFVTFGQVREVLPAACRIHFVFVLLGVHTLAPAIKKISMLYHHPAAHASLASPTAPLSGRFTPLRRHHSGVYGPVLLERSVRSCLFLHCKNVTLQSGIQPSLLTSKCLSRCLHTSPEACCRSHPLHITTQKEFYYSLRALLLSKRGQTTSYTGAFTLDFKALNPF